MISSTTIFKLVVAAPPSTVDRQERKGMSARRLKRIVFEVIRIIGQPHPTRRYTTRRHVAVHSRLP